MKYIWIHKRPQINKTLPSKKSNAGGITIPDFKVYYRTITIKTAWYWHKIRQKDQWIRIEDPDRSLHTQNLLIFNKQTQNTQWRKDSLFSKCCKENWISTCKRVKLNPYPPPCTKINSTWIKNLNK
jgi:hypothetical protein